MWERDAELARLRDLLAATPSSGGRVVLVRGPAGIGKSLLVRTFLDRAAGRARTWCGWCDDLATPQPLAPVHDVARASDAVATAVAHGDRRSVMDALLDLLSHPSRPTVLVFEDTQWADEATLDVITFLGRRIRRANGLLLLTYRDHEVDEGHPLRRVLGDLPPGDTVRMRLAPLSLDAVTAMVDDTDLDPRAVLDLTGGNPLFVSEVVASGADAVPQSVRDAVLARVGRLAPATRRLVELVSVFPGRAERDVVDRLLHPGPVELREAARQGLVHAHGDAIAFPHELQRRAVAASLPTRLRRTLHRDVLACLPDGADAARLVHHARGAGDVSALLAHGPLAARAALAAGSHREALAHFRAVGPHLDRLPAHAAADIADDWMRTEVHVGSGDVTAALARAVARRRAAGDARALAATLAFAVFPWEIHGHPDEAAACATEAVAIGEALPPGTELASALTEHARLHLVRGGDDDERLAVLDRAIAVAEEAGDDRTVASALILKGITLHHRRDRRGLQLIQRAHTRAARGGHRYEETDALVALASKAADVRDIARAAELAERARLTAARHELWSLEAFARAMLAELCLWRGDWDGAQDRALDALGVPDAEAVAWRILATIEVRRGASGAAVAVARMWDLAAATGDLVLMDPAAGVVAEYLWTSGRRRSEPDLVAVVDRTLQRALRAGPVWPSGAFALWMWTLGRLPAVPASLPDCHRWTIEGRWADAAAFWAARGAPFDEGLARMHGDDDHAVQAVRLFEDLGADGSAHALRRDLRDRGVRVPRGLSRAARDHAAGLTARQAEVLALLAEGLSNAGIAEELFISERTVENHVAAVLMKLDAPDRRQAVTAARARGLV